MGLDVEEERMKKRTGWGREGVGEGTTSSEG